MQELREYQRSAVLNVRDYQSQGAKVCLVAPTGSGKTRMGEAIAVDDLDGDGGTVAWYVHTDELLTQTAKRLRKTFGDWNVGIWAAGHPRTKSPLQVASIQTATCQDDYPPGELVVFDECHHYVADVWGKAAIHHQDSRIVGLTATPERGDGKPLGKPLGIFDELVVAAHYSELIRDGHLVPCQVYYPEKEIRRAWAQDPLDAYRAYAEGSQAFVFVERVEQAESIAARFRIAGIVATAVHGSMNEWDRRHAMTSFEKGHVRVLVNVHVLTEGVDVPAARTIILCRSPGHVSTYLQMVGRVLRPHPLKPYAILIDLSGASHRHGSPTEDRIYSLTGKAIQRASKGKTPAEAQGIQVGDTWVPPWVADLELHAQFRGILTPREVKEKVYARMRTMQREKKKGLQWVHEEFRKLFDAPPPLEFWRDVSQPEWYLEYGRLLERATKKGYKTTWAFMQFKTLYGWEPPWSFLQEWSKKLGIDNYQPKKILNTFRLK